MRKLGSYTIERPLFDFKDRLYDPKHLGPGEHWYRIEAGINGVTSIREIMKVDENFSKNLSPEIKVELQKNTEFYKVAVVYSFSHSRKVKFKFGNIRVECESAVNKIEPKVHSINPHRINHKERKNRKFGIGLDLSFIEIINANVGSYTSEREYEFLHPHIVGDFAASCWATWDYQLTPAIDDIIGAQLIEFIVKQPSSKYSSWNVLPDAGAKWGSKWQKFKSFFSGDEIQNKKIKEKIKKFTIPLD